MTAAILSFACGIMGLQLLPVLPAPGWLGAGVALVAACIGVRRLRIPVAFAAGFCWALGMAHWRLADRLAPELEGRDLEVVGVVSGLPAAGERGLRFEFEPERASAPAPARLPSRILLTWYRSTAYEDQPSPLSAPLHPGERWRLTVRLRRPHGLANPHGFDYEGWLLERGIGATGYVRPRSSPLLL